MNTTYSINVSTEQDAHGVNYALTARTDTGARRQWKQWLKECGLASGEKAWLCFRNQDGSTGYLETAE